MAAADNKRKGPDVAISAPKPAINTDKVPDPKPAPEAVPAFISEGTAIEVLTRGAAIDPRTGREVVKADVPSGRLSSIK